MIPKIIHQIWVGDFKLPNRERRLIEKMKSAHPSFEHKLWTEKDPDLPKAASDWYDAFYAIKNYAFCADILRIWKVYKHGGFYLDVDFDVSNKLDPFFEYDGVFFYHNDTDDTIPNNIFGAKINSPILEYCLSTINPEWSWYGPSWFGKVIKEYYKVESTFPQHLLKEKMKFDNIEYYQYYEFECKFSRHLSLYSWCPEVWNRLNNGEQL